MHFGYFDDPAREYVITTPQTPWPWINYLGTEDFFSLISNTAGGYCFYKDARLRRILRYRYNSVPPDMNGRYFYIRDGDDTWSPGWKPARAKLDEYRCRHGMGYTIIEGTRRGVKAEVLFFVPPGITAEVHRVRLTNTTQGSKSIRLFSSVEFCLWNALDDMTNFQRNFSTGEVMVDGSTIYHLTEYRERRNHFSFYSVNAPVAGFDTDRASFLGPDTGYEAPAAVIDQKPRNSVADGWSPIASHCIDVNLGPGRTRELVFVLGYAENPPDRKWGSDGEVNVGPAQRILDRLSSSKDVEREFDALRAWWDERLASYRVDSGDERLDRMVNIWNQYQCIVTYNLSRSASSFESGIGRGIGFRDSNQDIAGFVHQLPDHARRRILDLAATQFEDGGAYHQYQPLTKRGNHDIGGNFNDDPLWLIYSTSAYIKETGDGEILDESVPFDGDPGSRAPLMEHLHRAFMHVVRNLGPHGLPLIGRADWNDCLNLNCYSQNPDEPFQTCTNRDGATAESVLIAGMFCAIGPEYAEIRRRRGDEAGAAEAQIYIDKMRTAIDCHGWDGEWFLRAWDAAGKKVGSRECDEGRIFIEPQGYCIMGGVGLADGRAVSALDSVQRHLATPHGIVLVNPAYTRYDPGLGEISSYPPGYKENAGVFCHNNPWIIIAETLIGRGDRAFDYYRRISPAWREEIADLHKMEPYVYSQMIAGKDARRHGEAKNSWLTGTAAWCFVAVSQWILGIRPGWDGLIVDPCIPPEWDGFTVTRRFRGSIYRIEVKNPDHVSRGVAEVTVDGEKRGNGVIPALGDGREHRVVVELGRK